MKITAISSDMEEASSNRFIKYANSFMSSPSTEKSEGESTVVKPEEAVSNKKMGIEKLENYTIFPKENIGGKTVITA